MSSKNTLELNEYLIDKNGLMGTANVARSNIDVYQDNPKGSIRGGIANSNTLYSLSGSLSFLGTLTALGGTLESVIIEDTLASRSPRDTLFAIHEMSIYTKQGTVFSDAIGTGFIAEHWNSMADASDEKKLVARTVFTNHTATPGTYFYTSRWRYLQLPGGGKGGVA